MAIQEFGVRMEDGMVIQEYEVRMEGGWRFKSSRLEWRGMAIQRLKLILDFQEIYVDC